MDNSERVPTSNYGDAGPAKAPAAPPGTPPAEAPTQVFQNPYGVDAEKNAPLAEPSLVPDAVEEGE
jgi:hypothetical protein